MIQDGGVLRLDQEPRSSLTVLRVGHQLQGDDSPETRVAGTIHLTDPTGTEECLNFVPSQMGARLRGEE